MECLMYKKMLRFPIIIINPRHVSTMIHVVTRRLYFRMGSNDDIEQIIVSNSCTDLVISLA